MPQPSKQKLERAISAKSLDKYIHPGDNDLKTISPISKQLHKSNGHKK